MDAYPLLRIYLRFQNSSKRNSLLQLHKQMKVKLFMVYQKSIQGNGGITPLTLKP